MVEHIVSNEFPLKYVVVVGAGPIGLLVAIRLKQIGVREVALVDERMGEYVRSGNFELEVFAKFSEVLNLSLNPSQGEHIKDVERDLLPHAKALGVTLHKNKFETFKNGKMRISEGNSIDCDLVIDCTGTERAVIREINKLVPDVFLIKPARSLPHNMYMHARGTLNENDSTTVLHNTGKNILGLLDVSEFRFQKYMSQFHHLGWKELAPPFAYMHLIENEETRICKVDVYTQAPDEFEGEQSKLIWIESVLAFYAQNEKNSFTLMHDSQFHPTKKKISIFKLKPCKTTPAYFMKEKSGLPLVVHAGDAMANLPFLIGSSAIEGAIRANEFIKSLRVFSGVIVNFDTKYYDEKLRQCMARYDSMLAYHCDKRQKDFEQAHHYHYARLYKDATLGMSSILHEKNGIDFRKANALNVLDQAIARLEKALKLQHIQSESKQNIYVALLDIARRVKLLATYYFSNMNALADKYYRKSLMLYTRHFPGQYSDEVLKLYSNIMIINLRNKDFDEVIILGAQVREKFWSSLNLNLKSIAMKINVNQITAHIEKAKQILSRSNEDEKGSFDESKRADVMLEQAAQLLPQIIDYPLYHENLSKQIVAQVNFHSFARPVLNP